MLSVAGAPGTWIRIARRGGEHIGYVSADGTAWEELGRWPIPEGFPGTFHAGVFAGGVYPAGDESFVAVHAEMEEVTLVDCREGDGAPAVTRSIETDFCANPPAVALTLKARNVGTWEVSRSSHRSGLAGWTRWGTTCPANRSRSAATAEGAGTAAAHGLFRCKAIGVQ